MGTPFFYPASVVALEDLQQHHWNTEAQIIFESAPAKTICELVLLICGAALTKKSTVDPDSSPQPAKRYFFLGKQKMIKERAPVFSQKK